MINEHALTSKLKYFKMTDERSKFERENSSNSIHPECTHKPVRRIESAVQAGRVRVSEHAIERLKQRGGLSRKAKAEIIDWALTACVRGRKVRPRSKSEEIAKIISHESAATYIQYNDMVVVIENGVMVTAIVYDSTYWKVA